MKKFTFLAVVVTVISLFSTQAFAVFIYDEAIDGEIGELAGASPIWELTEGTNTIFADALLGDADDFIVRAAPGFEIIGGLFTTMIEGQGTAFINSNAIALVGGGNFFGQISGDVMLEVAAFSGLGLFKVENSGNADPFPWQFDFTVAAVNTIPAPGTLLLILAGLLCTRRGYKLTKTH